MDVCLYQQLWALHENLQEFKQNRERTDTNSECSSLCAEQTFDSLREFEPIYENVASTEHVYENYEFPPRNSSDVIAKHRSSFKQAKPLCMGPESKTTTTTIASTKREYAKAKKTEKPLARFLTQTSYESSL